MEEIDSQKKSTLLVKNDKENAAINPIDVKTKFEHLFTNHLF
jgi:hypothetical protein